MKLSIILVCYNHEKYVEEAVSSIFMQEANFRYEIIVADDFSSDNTLGIIQKFQLLYPEKIKILSSDKNLGITKNYQRAFKACSGEYIAILEGDDYWISPKKLIKQINFLDAYPGCSFCFHRFIGYNQKAQEFFSSPKISENIQVLSTEDLIRENFIGNFSTCMYKKEIINQIPDNLYDLLVYDWMFNIVNSQYGNIGYLTEFLSVYRIHNEGIWSKKNKKSKIIEITNCIDQYNKFLNYEFDAEFEKTKLNLNNKFFLSLKKMIRLVVPPLIIIVFKLICPPVVMNIIKRHLYVE
jgi:glycosyltransferase involved in cell wall biosynthesis